MNPRVRSVRATGLFQVALEFTDGSTGSVDLSTWIGGRSGVFAPLQDPTFFAQVAVDAGTIAWPNGVDLDPDMLYQAARSTVGRVPA